MRLDELSPDEQFLRLYYLRYASHRFSSLAGELPYFLPAAIFAYFSWHYERIGPLWTAFAYLVGLYLWRIVGNRWTKATATLVSKYEQALAVAPAPD
jgi:hypothetical protein